MTLSSYLRISRLSTGLGSGQLFVCGVGLSGQLGLGDVSHAWHPRPVPLPLGFAVHELACGFGHVLALATKNQNK